MIIKQQSHIENMEIYEHWHLFDAIIDFAILLGSIILGIVILPHYPTSNIAKDIAIIPIFALSFISLIIMGFKIRRYFDLCIKRQPIIILNNECIMVYSSVSTKKYTIIQWKDVEKFGIFQTKMGDYCYPIYHNKSLNPSQIALLFGIHKDRFRINFTDLSEEEILNLLNNHISKRK